MEVQRKLFTEGDAYGQPAPVRLGKCPKVEPVTSNPFEMTCKNCGRQLKVLRGGRVQHVRS